MNNHLILFGRVFKATFHGVMYNAFTHTSPKYS